MWIDIIDSAITFRRFIFPVVFLEGMSAEIRSPSLIIVASRTFFFLMSTGYVPQTVVSLVDADQVINTLILLHFRFVTFYLRCNLHL